MVSKQTNDYLKDLLPQKNSHELVSIQPNNKILNDDNYSSTDTAKLSFSKEEDVEE